MTGAPSASVPCPTCGRRHLDLATAMGSASPHAWDVATVARREAGELTDDVCFLPDVDAGGGTSYFVRGELLLPLLDAGQGDTFSWSVWVLLSGESLELLFEHWDDPDRAERVAPVFGLLASELPYEPSTLDLRAVVHTRAPGLVPRVELEQAPYPPHSSHDPHAAHGAHPIVREHPLVVEQAEGITWHRVAELNAAVYGELH